MKGLLNSWRIPLIAVGFLVVGIQGLIIGSILIPLLRRVSDPEQVELRSQRLIQRGWRVLVRYLRWTGLVHVHVHGLENVRPGCMLVANHPTLIDTPVVVSMLPQVDCIISPSYSHIFAIRRAIAGAGYLSSDQGLLLVETAAARLRRGRILLIYPEGTRSPEVGAHPLHRGAAHIALRAGCDVVPVVLTAEPRTLVKGRAWYHAADRPIEYTIRVGEPIEPRPRIEPGESRARAAKRVTAQLQEVLGKGIGTLSAGPSGAREASQQSRRII